MEIKRIDIKEFREKGYLQELNRNFLHPLGLALEVKIDTETGEEILGGIWDYREEETGMIYDLKNSDEDRLFNFRAKSKMVNKEMTKKLSERWNKYGFGIEVIP